MLLLFILLLLLLSRAYAPFSAPVHAFDSLGEHISELGVVHVFVDVVDSDVSEEGSALV